MQHLLLRAQAWWDAQRFDQPAWQVAAWRDQKVRHIQLPVAKALGKVVAAYGAEADTASGTDAMARVRDEVLPDVAIYRSQLMNTFPDWDAPTAALAHASPCQVPRAAATPPWECVPDAAPWFSVVAALSRA